MNPAMPMSMWRGRPPPRISMRGFNRSSIIPKEGHEPQPEHIERGDERGDHSYHPVDPACLISPPQNLIFTKKPGQRRDSGNCKSRNRHGPKCPRDLRPPTAHLAHVMLATDGMDHRTGCQEQQTFEERMRHEMKYPSGERSNTAGQKHVSKLRNSGIGENFLDVRLRNSNG